MPSLLIDTQKELDAACARLACQSVLGVDTEFLRVRTYYPRLALVQVSTTDAVYCFDPLAEALDLDELWSVLADTGILKVVHSARQDIEVLLYAAQVMPAPLFDTQIAGALVGYPEQMGYAALVEAEFGEVLPKGAQRTDWTRRPLSQAQLGYAENDVRYLLGLHERLREQLVRLGRLDWAREDFERVLDPALYDPDPETAYRRVGRGAHMKGRAQHRLRKLCAWREQAARRRDLPRHWVVNDQLIASIAEAAPRSVADLQRVGGMSEEIWRRDGKAIVQCLSGEPVDAQDDEPLWAKQLRLSEEQKAAKAALSDALKSKAAELGIAESVLATRADLDKLARGASVEETFTGWRRGAIGEEFERVLQQRREALSAVPEDVHGNEQR